MQNVHDSNNVKQLIHVYKVKGGLYKKEKRQYEQKFLRNSDPFRQCIYATH